MGRGSDPGTSATTGSGSGSGRLLVEATFTVVFPVSTGAGGPGGIGGAVGGGGGGGGGGNGTYSARGANDFSELTGACPALWH